jgi:Predicted NADH:ubiquinone oxidoreductase, subunit RnfG
MKDTLKLSLVLSLYTVVACLALAFVHNFTEPIIQKVKEQKSKEALQSIFPLATSFEDILSDLGNMDGNIKIQSAFVAKKEDEDIGLTIQATGPTYAHATILIGITMDKKISSIKFLELLDTPSLGSKAAEEPFIGQFKGKGIKDNFSVGDDVVAISGATITSRGVSAILKTASSLIDAYMDKKGEAK